MSYLLVQNEPTVELTGYLDATGALQVSHSSGNLIDYDDALQAEDPGASIRIKLMDFISGTTTWTLNASHPGDAGPVNWSRGSNYAYYDFAVYMSNFLPVTITATASGQGSKQKIIDVKSKPEQSLPDDDG
jgi:hypothetical protein